jgi:CRP/FNR family transcriptional regulator
VRTAVETLRGLPLFAGLSDEAVTAIADRTVPRRLPKHATLFRRGEPCHGLYIVVEGRIQIYRASPDGREQVLEVEGPGRPVAELPLFDGGPYPASARALEDSRLLFLPRDAFQWLYQSNPEIADAVIRDLGRRLRRMVGLIAKITLKDVRSRVAATLVEVAESQDALRAGGTFVLQRTQEELARSLATTREGVARALASLRRDGIIAQSGRKVEILDVAALQSAAMGMAD